MSRRNPKNADEFMREPNSDPKHRAADAERESELARQETAYADAEAPSVQALRQVGVEVDSVWDPDRRAGGDDD